MHCTPWRPVALKPERRRALRPLLLAISLGLLLTLALPAALALAANIQVNTTVDELDHNGTCSLREAVQAANLDMAVDGCPAGSGADKVILPAGVYQLVITGGLNSGPVQPTRPLVIQGAGPGKTIIESGPHYTNRLFWFFDDRFELRDVTVRNAKALGAILVSSNATLLISNTQVISNTSTGDGGAIENFGSLTVIHALLGGNRSSGTGGAIWSRKQLTLLNSQVTHNHASEDGGGLANDAGALFVQNSTVADNTGGRGGGIFNRGGRATIEGALVARNAATSTFGGGIINLLGVMTVTQTTVENNHAVQAAGGIGNAAIFFPPLAAERLRVQDSHILSNTAPDAAGIGTAGRLELVNSEVSYNQASGLGGGLGNDSYVYSTTTGTPFVGTSIVTNTVFHANHAARGAGIASGSTLTVTGGQLTGNVATVRGGGMSIGSGSVYMTHTMVSGNQAPLGAGIFNTYESQYQGAPTSTRLVGVTLAHNADDGLVVAGGTVTTTALLLDQNGGTNCTVTGGKLTSTGGNSSTDKSCAAFFTAPGDDNNATPAQRSVLLPLVIR